MGSRKQAKDVFFAVHLIVLFIRVIFFKLYIVKKLFIAKSLKLHLFPSIPMYRGIECKVCGTNEAQKLATQLSLSLVL